jgi:hypothetical protein
MGAGDLFDAVKIRVTQTAGAPSHHNRPKKNSINK